MVLNLKSLRHNAWKPWKNMELLGTVRIVLQTSRILQKSKGKTWGRSGIHRIAVFLGKADKGQILKETPQLRVWCED